MAEAEGDAFIVAMKRNRLHPRSLDTPVMLVEVYVSCAKKENI